jgi:hypothetical protein
MAPQVAEMDSTGGRRTESQAASALTVGEHEALVAARHRLEVALEAAASRREQDWARRVAAACEEVHRLLTAHVESAEGPAGLLEEIERSAPMSFTRRLRRLRTEHHRLQRALMALARDSERAAQGEPISPRRLRRRLGRLLTRLSEHGAQEADLVLEAFSVVVGVGD